MSLMFAYGMNTNAVGMKNRCPDAAALGAAILENFRFRFAYHADIVPCAGQKVHGVLWEITSNCLQNLDILEGYPYYYNRILVPVQYKSARVWSYVYHMQPGHEECSPRGGYLDMVVEGYRQHGLEINQIYTGLDSTKI